MTYTIEDLDKARADLAHLNERDNSDTSGNPMKYHSRIQDARRKIMLIENQLKADGLIPRSDQEQLEHRLDAAFPKAKTRETVTFENKTYQKRFRPLTRSRKGNPTSWQGYWLEVPDI